MKYCKFDVDGLIGSRKTHSSYEYNFHGVVFYRSWNSRIFYHNNHN